MLYRTHFVFGLLFGLVFLQFFHVDYWWVFLLLVGLFSLLPDIDSPKSKIGRKIPVISHILNFIFGHRKIFHSMFFPVGLFVLFYLLGLSFVGFCILIGGLSHIIGDSLTREGINFFYPLGKFKVRGFIKTGGILENVVFWVFVVVIIVYFVRLF